MEKHLIECRPRLPSDGRSAAARYQASRFAVDGHQVEQTPHTFAACRGCSRPDGTIRAPSFVETVGNRESDVRMPVLTTGRSIFAIVVMLQFSGISAGAANMPLPDRNPMRVPAAPLPERNPIREAGLPLPERNPNRIAPETETAHASPPEARRTTRRQRADAKPDDAAEAKPDPTKWSDAEIAAERARCEVMLKDLPGRHGARRSDPQGRMRRRRAGDPDQRWQGSRGASRAAGDRHLQHGRRHGAMDREGRAADRAQDPWRPDHAHEHHRPLFVPPGARTNIDAPQRARPRQRARHPRLRHRAR